MGKGQSLPHTVLGKVDVHTPKITLVPYLPPLTKINSKWIEDTNVGPQIIQPLEENIGRRLRDVSLGNVALDGLPKAPVTKAKVKLKSVCTANSPQNEKATCRLGGSICKPHTR